MYYLPSLLLTAFIVQAWALPDKFGKTGAKYRQYGEGSCCALLNAKLPEKVLVRGIDNVTANVETYYAAQQQQQTPACVVFPSSPDDVSVAVKILTRGFEEGFGDCEFALRSGGHAPGASISNIDNGVTLDLSNLNMVELSLDRTYVSVGPGNRWADVYSKLDPQNLTAVGGRSRTVGVGGLILSGGLSYLAPRYGLACDNIFNFEVVLADGSIVNANASSHADLYKALKGGSNNFGVVTRFDTRVIEQGPFWGGMSFYNASSLPRLISSLSKFANSDGHDEYAQLTLLFGLVQNSTTVIMHEHYSKTDTLPPEDLFAEINAEATQDTFRIDTMTNYTIEEDARPDGGTVRKAFVTVCYTNHLEMLQRAADLSLSTADSLRPAILQFISTMQPFNEVIFSKSLKNGGNFLGLVGSGDKVIFQTTVTWLDKANDELIYSTLRSMYKEGNALAVELAADDDFIIQNYAAPWQDVYAGIGEANRAELRRISEKYDPAHTFQKQVPGGFKL